MRQLATVQRISALDSIPGADMIVVASVLGWRVVVRKSDGFTVNDLVVFCEPDSVLPDRPAFEFLRADKFRIRTRRFKNQISQGICFNLSVLDGLKFPNDDRVSPKYDLVEGMDVSGMLGVVKYEPPIAACLSGIVKGNFPGFVQKTDETRVQVLQPLLDKYKGMVCYVTEKVDGSSASFFLRDGVFGVCSRNLEFKESVTNSMWKFAREKGLEENLRRLKRNLALQGEVVGPGINKNTLKLKEVVVLFFSVYDIDGGRYLDFEDARKVVNDLGLRFVPVLDTNYVLGDDVDGLVKMSVGKSVINSGGWREGVVIRPLKEIYDSAVMPDVGGRISFKVVNPEYLLATGG